MSKDPENRSDASKPAKKGTYRSLMTMDQEVTRKSRNNTSDRPKRRSNVRRSRSRSRSPIRKVKKTEEVVVIDYDIPDKSFGDYYCKPCDCHMNSENMWESHLQGKRHLKHAKQGDVADLKYDYVDENPLVQPTLDAAMDPIVGLHHICETQRLEQNPMYNCFLCSANLPTSSQLMEHLCGLKHYMAFVKEHDSRGYNIISSSDLKKSTMEPLLRELVVKIQNDMGPTKMQVRREKDKSGGYSSYSNYTPKKAYKEDLDFRHRETSRKRRSASPPQWKRNPSRYDKSSDHHHQHKAPYDDKVHKAPYDDHKAPSYRDDRYSERAKDYRSPTRDVIQEPEPHFNQRSSHQPNLTNEPKHANYVDQPSTPWGNIDDNPRGTDLREVLKQKKAQEYYRAEPAPIPNPSSSSVAFDDLLTLFNNLPTAAFLSLVLFRLEDTVIKDEEEEKLLEKLVNKSANLAIATKSQKPSDLQMKFQRSMMQNGINFDGSMQNPSVTSDERLMQMVGQLKNLKNVSDSAYPPTYSTRPDPAADTFHRQGGVHGTQDTSVLNDMSASRTSSSYSSSTFSSSYSSIPGLTLTDEAPQPVSYSSVTQPRIVGLDQWASSAKSILSSLEQNASVHQGNNTETSLNSSSSAYFWK